MAGHRMLRNGRTNNRRVVKQRNRTDCAICAISMASGLSYDEVVRRVGCYYQPDLGTWDVDKAAKLCGVKVQIVRSIKLNQPSLVSYLVRVLDNGIALNHMVYWDGERAWDPASRPGVYEVVQNVFEISS